MSELPPLSYGRATETAKLRWTRWAAKWILRVCISIVLLAILAHTVCLVWATHRLNMAIAPIVAAGEPVAAADLQSPDVPADQNAMVDLGKAADALGRTTLEQNRVESFDNLPPLIDVERTRLRAYLDRCTAASSMIDRAATKPSNALNGPPPDPMLVGSMPMLAKLRMAANYTRYEVELYHDIGCDRLAMHKNEELETIALSAAAHRNLIGYLVSAGIREMQAFHVTAVAPTLRIGPAETALADADVRKLIIHLLDYREIADEERQALQGERVFQISEMSAMDAGDYNFGQVPTQPKASIAKRYLFRPYVRWNAGSCVEMTTGILASVPASDWPTARAQVANLLPGSFTLNFFANVMLPSYTRALEVRYRLETDRALAAVALAARLHVVEVGKTPLNWADLVPRFLPAIPLDPMATNKPLQARFDSDDPIVWSVGSNGLDDGADDRKAHQDDGDWACRDRVLHLIPRPRTFSADQQLLIELDLDSPVRKSPAATTQSAVAATQPIDMNPPD